MSTSQIVPRNQLCFDQFEGIDVHFLTILKFLRPAELETVLSKNTRIYLKLVEEFYLNGIHTDGMIKTKVKEITVIVEPREVGVTLWLLNEGVTDFATID